MHGCRLHCPSEILARWHHNASYQCYRDGSVTTKGNFSFWTMKNNFPHHVMLNKQNWRYLMKERLPQFMLKSSHDVPAISGSSLNSLSEPILTTDQAWSLQFNVTVVLIFPVLSFSQGISPRLEFSTKTSIVECSAEADINIYPKVPMVKMILFCWNTVCTVY